MKIAKIKRQIHLYQGANMRIGKIVIGSEYRMEKHFQNLLIFLNFDSFPNWKNSENLLISQVIKIWKFVNFPI